MILISAQKSICPNIFQYNTAKDEISTTSDTNTWYGTLHLFSSTILHGIFVDIIFDKKIINVGNHFYAAITSDNIEYHIQDQNYKLKPGETLDIQFYVKFNRKYGVPKIREIRLNGKNICANESQQLSTTTTSLSISNNYNNRNNNEVDKKRESNV